MISDELIVPVCDECRDHPQLFLNDEGRWVCGACWLECGMVVDMTPKPEMVEQVERRVRPHAERSKGNTMSDPMDSVVLKMQRDSLRDALRKALDTRDKEAKAWFAYKTARDNYSGGARMESRRHLAAMQAASNAEREARALLLTLRDAPTRKHLTDEQAWPRISNDG